MVEDVRMELRDKIAEIILDETYQDGVNAYVAAEPILAIPRIAEALSQTPGVSGSVE